MAAPDAHSAGSGGDRTAARRRTVGQRAGRAINRLGGAWRSLDGSQRLAGVAAVLLGATLFLPWYQTSFAAQGTKGAQLLRDVQTGIEAFTFVEAAVLVVVLGVLLLLFARGERRPFHLPGGDGTIIMLAGVWASALITWRLFDKPELGRGVAVKLQWGMAVAMGAALLLAWAGVRVRRAQVPEPPLRDDERRGRRQVEVGADRPWLAETEPLPARTTPRPAPRQETGEAETVALPGEVPEPEDPPEAPSRPSQR
jgi:hypothetical protein